MGDHLLSDGQWVSIDNQFFDPKYTYYCLCCTNEVGTMDEDQKYCDDCFRDIFGLCSECGLLYPKQIIECPKCKEEIKAIDFKS